MSKKFILTGLVLAMIISLFGTGLIKPKNISAEPTYLVGVTPTTNQDLGKLSKIGFELNAPAHPAAISSDVALKNARVTYPGLANNENYSIEYQVLTSPKFNLFSVEALEKNPVLKSSDRIDHLPVYIIIYKNMLIPYSTPSGTSPQKQDSSVPEGYKKGEYNIVVDATSGVPLMVFSYR